MRIALAVTSLAMLALAACSDATTAPDLKQEAPANKKVAILAASEIDNEFFAFSGFGQKVTDTTTFTLGLDILPFGGYGTEIVLDAGKTAVTTMLVGSASSMGWDPAKPSVFRFTSHWQAVEPEKHRGVIYSDASDIMLLVAKYVPNGVGSISPSSIVYQHTTSKDVFSTLELKNEKGLVKFVTPTQLKNIGCAGNDSLVLMSPQRITTRAENTFYGTATDSGYAPVTKFVCTMYESVESAEQTLAAHSIAAAHAHFNRVLGVAGLTSDGRTARITF